MNETVKSCRWESASLIRNGKQRRGVSPATRDFKCKSGSLELNRLEGGDVLVVSKLHPGFDDECVDDLTRLLSAISARAGPRVQNIWCLISRIDAGAKGGARRDSEIWSLRTRSLSSRLQLSPSPGSALSWRAPISNSRVIARCWWPKGAPFSRSTETPTDCWALCVAGA